MDKILMTIEEIRHEYNMYNLHFFGGRLPSVGKIMFLYDDTERDAAGYTFINNVEGYKSSISHTYPDEYMYVIAINSKTCTSKKHICSVLAHEMIHIYQMVLDFDKYSNDYSWNMSHNKVFITKMAYVNSRAKELGIDIKVGLTFED